MIPLALGSRGNAAPTPHCLTILKHFWYRRFPLKVWNSGGTILICGDHSVVGDELNPSTGLD
jgi:hypothetical protein